MSEVTDLSVITLDNSVFKQALEQSQLAIVDVYADWCGPCLRFSPVFEQTATEYLDIDFFKIDAEACPDFRETVHIPVLPFVVAFSKGQILESESLSTQAALRRFLDKIKES